MCVQNVDLKLRLMKSETQGLSKNFPGDSEMQRGLGPISHLLPPLSPAHSCTPSSPCPPKLTLLQARAAARLHLTQRTHSYSGFKVAGTIERQFERRERKVANSLKKTRGLCKL